MGGHGHTWEVKTEGDRRISAIVCQQTVYLVVDRVFRETWTASCLSASVVGRVSQVNGREGGRSEKAREKPTVMLGGT